MIVLNGKETAAAVKKEIAAKVAEMVSRGERPPHLVAVLVGDNGAWPIRKRPVRKWDSSPLF